MFLSGVMVCVPRGVMVCVPLWCNGLCFSVV